MGIETEKKFLPANDSWKKLVGDGATIKQGYLNIDPDRCVRVRTLCSLSQAGKAFITIKGGSLDHTNTKRKEFEYEIPFADGIELLEMSVTPIIEKIRYTLGDWEIDVFDGENKGLVLIELELKQENIGRTQILPSFIGQQVTMDNRYFNLSLARNPYSTWDIAPIGTT